MLVAVDDKIFSMHCRRRLIARVDSNGARAARMSKRRIGANALAQNKTCPCVPDSEFCTSFERPPGTEFLGPETGAPKAPNTA